MEIEGIDAHEAIRRVAPQIVFTTHTPVPAGHDRFPDALIEEHLGPLRDSLGPRLRAPSWVSAASTRSDHGEEFCMTVLALKLSPARQRGVVAARPGLARDVERTVSRPLGRSRADRPHHQRRARADVARAADAAGLRPPPRPGLAATRRRSPGFWEAIDTVDDGELWETHQTLKAQLVEIGAAAGGAARRARAASRRSSSRS